jgi:hypothetical protein
MVREATLAKNMKPDTSRAEEGKHAHGKPPKAS